MGRKGDCLEDLHTNERIILKKYCGRVYVDWIYFAQNPGQCGDFVNTVRNAGNLERLLHGGSITSPDLDSMQMYKYLWLLYGEDEMNMAVF
jgi:hypothetical protein